METQSRIANILYFIFQGHIVLHNNRHPNIPAELILLQQSLAEPWYL
jgi:hypothetical protein